MNDRVQEAVITTQRGVSMTEYRIKGSLPAVFSVIERIFKDKAPAGYGTMVHTITQEYPDGDFNARVSHSNSCD